MQISVSFPQIERLSHLKQKERRKEKKPEMNKVKKEETNLEIDQIEIKEEKKRRK